MRIHFVVLAAALWTSACSKAPSSVQTKTIENNFSSRQDIHSYSNPQEVRVRHVALDLDVLFGDKILRGSATLTLDREQRGKPLILDTRDLKVSKTEVSSDGNTWSPTSFQIGEFLLLNL